MIETKHLLKVMTFRSTEIVAIVVVLAVVCLGVGDPTRVDAVPSQMSHEMSGIVQRMNHQNLLIVVNGASKPELFEWNSKDTKFFRDGVPVASDSLHAGTQVQIRCSHPYRFCATSLPRFLED